jgi:hypothetical protein
VLAIYLSGEISLRFRFQKNFQKEIKGEEGMLKLTWRSAGKIERDDKLFDIGPGIRPE